MRPAFPLVCSLALLAGATPAQPPPDAVAAALRELRARGADLERALQQRLTRVLAARGGPVSLDAEADRQRLRLAALRHDLAAADGRRDDAERQVREIISVRERDLGRTLALARRGAASAGAADSARCRLANAHYRLALEEGRRDDAVAQLRLILGLREADVRRLEALRRGDAALAGELTEARWGVACVRYHLAKAAGRDADVLKHLREMVALRGQSLRDAERWTRGGFFAESVPADLTDRIGALLLEDRFRLALAAGKPAEALPLLDRLLALAEAGVNRPALDPVESLERRWELAAARYRRALAAADVKLAAFDPLGELDF